MKGATNRDFDDGTPTQPDVVVSFSDREKIEKRNRSELESELLAQSLRLTVGPYYASVQFTNYCNMSCIMCWNGGNPVVKQMADDLIAKIGSQVGPHISILEPNSGSEPLGETWEATNDLATRYGLQLVLTTNAQYLDEQRFEELKNITESLCISFDCYIPEVYSKIRIQADVKTVFENIKKTARLAREQGLECQVNLVLMAINAPYLVETIKFVDEIGIDTINVIQMIRATRGAYNIDVAEHCSEDYIEGLKEAAIELCRKREMRLVWRVGKTEIHEFRGTVKNNERQKASQLWNWRMKRVHPGFCEYAFNRVTIGVEGDVKPCGFAGPDELNLGDLNNDDFDLEIWNGPDAMDLRRGMYCGDVPATCEKCCMHAMPEPAENMYFLQDVMQNPKWANDFFKIKQKRLDLPVVSEHGRRYQEPPTLKVKTPQANRVFLLGFAIGGESLLIGKEKAHVESLVVDATIDKNGIAELKIPQELWSRLRTNIGYWWAAWQANDDQTSLSRTSTIQCFIRHQHLPRVAGSQLAYRTHSELPVLEKSQTK